MSETDPDLIRPLSQLKQSQDQSSIDKELVIPSMGTVTDIFLAHNETLK